eukprot:COSAG02_NODE_936_length_15800_cov_56.762945_12_plen_455_part_01
MANCPSEVRACIATSGCMAMLAHELTWAAETRGELCGEPGQCSPEVRAIVESCRPFAPPPEEKSGVPPCGFFDFMASVHQTEQALFHDGHEDMAMELANATYIAGCAEVLMPGVEVSPRCSDHNAPTGPKNCEFARLVDCWNRWDRELTPMHDKWDECKPLLRPCEHAYSTMLGEQCQVQREEEVVYARVVLGLNIDMIRHMEPTDYAHFVSDLESDLAALLGIDAGRVKVVDIVGGSIVVTFSVRHDEYGRLPPADLFDYLRSSDARFPKIQYMGPSEVIDVWVDSAEPEEPFRCTEFSHLVDSGLISDGDRAYVNNMRCSWILSCSTGGYVPQVTFQTLDTEAGWDYVNLFDGVDDTGRGLAQFHGDKNNGSLPGPLNGTSNSVFMQFTSDGSVVRNGFTASFECVMLGHMGTGPSSEPWNPASEPSTPCDHDAQCDQTIGEMCDPVAFQCQR